MGLVDGLCCASLRNVSDNQDEIDAKKKDHLRKFMASYDLGHLNNTATSEESVTSNSIQENSGELSRKSTMPMSNKSTERTSTSQHHEQPVSALLHTVVPSSFLPRDYGITQDERAQQVSRRVPGDQDSFCHSCPSFTYELDEQQPHTLTPSDTYTTVSMSQSYIWDDDEEEGDGYYVNSHTLSPAGSVFRCDSVDAEEENSALPASQPSFTTKSHEAFKYLLRMKPQNYMHQSLSSDDYDYSNHCGLFLYYSDASSSHLEEMG